MPKAVCGTVVRVVVVSTWTTASMTLRERGAMIVWLGELLSVAAISMVVIPLVAGVPVGVPEMLPSGLRVSPVGRVPLLMAKV